ncbi:MAG: glycoside hydrolase family 43 protein [Treponema sp.]|nr:glycoside hydrolase family 43 protein [Treponema sp.]
MNKSLHSYRNPVIPGFNPDPSICRDNEDYYLVTSTFEFFPGVPIYHSRNLVNWRLISYCLTRTEQLPLKNSPASAGIYAPTLRKNKGTFYMTTTNVTEGGNFIVHTEDIHGSWSNPVYIDQGGIDPSLLFVDEKIYFCSTGNKGENGIFVCEIDPKSGRKFTDSVRISTGCGGRFAEAPHLYYINNWFYLMLAEGGTEYGHMVTMQRSKNIYGPYERCPINPIISHRDRGWHPIQAVGHADIIQDHKGAWWMVCLGIRPALGLLHHLGRETFLLPLKWENGWPLPATTLELEMEAPLPAEAKKPDYDFETDFSTGADEPEWNYLRARDSSCFERKDGKLYLTANGQKLSEPGTSPAFTGIRQKFFDMEAITVLSLDDVKPGTVTGISAFYNNDYHYDLCIENKNGTFSVIVNKRIHDLEAVVFRKVIEVPAEKAELRIKADKKSYHFAIRIDKGQWCNCGSALTAGLSTEGTCFMTFTGVYIGLFCDSGKAAYEYFSMKEMSGGEQEGIGYGEHIETK